MRTPLPAATLLVLGANTAVLILINPRMESVETLGFIPAQPTLQSALTSLFVHASWLHWLKNALFLGVFGWYVERALCARRWLVLYFLSGLGAIGTHWAMSLTIQPALYREGLVGASGAISGLVGYFALRFYRRRVRVVWRSPGRWGLAIPLWVGVVFWVLLQGAGAIVDAGQPMPSEVGYWAHLGGFAVGLTLAIVWGAGAAGEREYALQQAELALEQSAAGDTLRWLNALPAEPRTLYLRGAAWAMLGDLSEARDALAQALTRALDQNDYPHAAQAADLLGELEQLQTLETLTLRTLLRHAHKHHDTPRALRWLESLTQSPNAPDRPEWLLLRARTLKTLGHNDAARQLLQQLIAEYPDTLQAAMAQLERCE